MRGFTCLSFLAATLAGIFLGRYCGYWAIPLLGLALAFTLAAHIRGSAWAWSASLPCCFLVLGSLLMLVSCAAASRGVLVSGARQAASATIEGRVVSIPLVESDRTSFFVEVGWARVGPCEWKTSEIAYLTCDGRLDPQRFFQGVHLKAAGRLALPGRYGGWLKDRGAGCTVSCSARSVELSARKPDIVSSMIARVRRSLSESYGRLFDRRTAGLLEGVTISKLDGIDPAVTADLRACGLSHIVAVSGLHVGSAVMIVLALAGALGAGRRARFAVSGMTAVSVLGLANLRVSAARATAMAAAMFGGTVVGRKYDSLVAVSLAGTALLCLNPRSAFDPSFQYSFAAAIAIIAFTRRKAAAPRGRIRRAAAVCAAAQLGTLALVLARGEAAPVSAIVANVLVIWLIGPLLLTAIASATLAMVSFSAGRALSLVPALISRYVLWIASLLARLPGAGFSMGALGVLAIGFYTVALFCLALSDGNTSVAKPLVALGISALLVMCAAFPIVRIRSGYSMVALDVGEGDATLIRDGTGGTMLVDGGPDPELLIEKLRSRGVSRIDLMVCTHPHADHVEGLVEALRRVPVGRLLEPGMPESATSSYSRLQREARARGVGVTTGREGLTIEVTPHMSLEVLRAPRDMSDSPENLNDSSMVFLVELGGSRILVTGDIEASGQRELVADKPDLDCDVLKIPHHGSSNALEERFLAAADPEIATVSAGRDNGMGHPSHALLDALAARGIAVARTDLSGDIVMSFHNGRIGLEKGR